MVLNDSSTLTESRTDLLSEMIDDGPMKNHLFIGSLTITQALSLRDHE